MNFYKKSPNIIIRLVFLSFISLSATFANGESYQEFFDRICDNVIPPKAVFQMPISSYIPTYMWPQDRKEIVKIRESVDTRCGEFLLNLYGHIFKITAGVPRNLYFSLKYPNKYYPYLYEGSMIPLNLVLFKEEIRLNEHDVPIGKSYSSLIRGFILPEDIKTFATNILRILKCRGIKFSKAELLEKNLEIAGLIITSEYFRGKQSLSIAYTELYKLKHAPTLDNLTRLFRMPDCELIFPKAGGAKAIMQTKASTLIASFKSMLDIELNDPSNKEISLIYHKLSQDNRKIAKEEFFAGKLEKLRYIYDEISEYTPSKFKPYTKALYALQKLKLSSILLQWRRIARIEKLIRTINSDDIISQFNIFKQIYNFVQENNVSYKVFQSFKKALPEQAFIGFMKELFLKIDNNAKELQRQTRTRKFLGDILGDTSSSSIRRFLYERCPKVENKLRVVDLSEIIEALKINNLIPEQFITTFPTN